MKAFKFAIFTLAIVLSACATMQPGTNLPKPTSGLITPTEGEPTGVSTSTLTPTETPPTSSAELISIKMLDAISGWGLTETQVVRTTDAGSTWMDVSPSEKFSGGVIGTSFFLNKDSAWLLAPDPVEFLGSGTLYRTKDGGRNWTSLTTPFGGGSLTFLDEKNGWMMADLGAGAGSQAVAVYQTTDSGTSWKLRSTNDPTREGAETSLPLGGIKYELVPLDMNTAFIGGVVYSPGTVYVYRSEDAGMSWNQVSLALPSGMEEADVVFERLQLVDQNNGFLALRLFSDTQKLVIYSTQDQGKDWVQLPDEFTPGGMVQFVSAVDGLVYNAGSFWVTRDSGRHWSEIQPDKEFGDTITDMDFVDTDLGWVLSRNEEDQTELYKTEDGGLTWTVVDGPSSSGSGLSLEQVRNAPYRLGARDDHATVQLVNGIYESDSDLASPDFARVSVVPDVFASGDLNQDGMNEEVVVVVENYGGTGNFAYLSVYRSEAGAPIFQSSTFIDDRPLVKQLEIGDDKLILDAVIHGAGDPGCCPKFRVQQTYSVTHNGISLQRFDSWIPDGRLRSIRIETPENGRSVGNLVDVQGKFTISPFENTLAYRIFDAAGKELAAGPITVQAEMGEPGVFKASIDLSSIHSGVTVRLEIQDLSAADGSLLAMDSVDLVVQ